MPIIGDSIFEANETFSLILANATNARIAVPYAIGRILNDDPRQPKRRS